MKRQIQLSAIAAFCALSPNAHAEVFRYSFLDATFDDGGTLVGFFDWDTTATPSIPGYTGAVINYEISIDGGNLAKFVPVTLTDEVFGVAISAGGAGTREGIRFGDFISQDVQLSVWSDAAVYQYGVDLVIPDIVQPGFSSQVVDPPGADSFEARGISAGQLVRILLPPTLAADFNQDGTVDLLDFDILAQNFGTVGGATDATGDANGDGNVDLLDFDTLAQQFGSTSPATVPEPASAALLCLAAPVLFRARRRCA